MLQRRIQSKMMHTEKMIPGIARAYLFNHWACSIIFPFSVSPSGMACVCGTAGHPGALHCTNTGSIVSGHIGMTVVHA